MGIQQRRLAPRLAAYAFGSILLWGATVAAAYWYLRRTLPAEARALQLTHADSIGLPLLSLALLLAGILLVANLVAAVVLVRRRFNCSTYTVVQAQPEHVAFLPEIERAAAGLFPPEVLPPHLREHTVPTEVLEAARAMGHLWVALDPEGRPVGFALAQVSGVTVRLAEMDVHPDHGRRGVGRALVDAVVGWARAAGLASVSLTTFADLPWNRPFYERLGFRRLRGQEVPAELALALQEEAESGLHGRIAMQLSLNAA